VRYCLTIKSDDEARLSLIANVIIGIAYGIIGCVLLWTAEVQMTR